MDINNINKPTLKVPEGYFDTLAESINAECRMQRAESEPAKSKGGIKISVLRRGIAAAACVAVLLIGGATYYVATQQNVDTIAAIGSNDDFDQLADYMMLDNEAIYAALAD